MPDINGIPYVDSTDLVSAYPTVSQALAQEVSDQLASKVDYALTANAQSGTGASAYTFVLADAQRLTTATGTTAKTFTIPPQASVAWVANSIIRVANYGAGDLTIAGGSGVTVTNATKTLAQFESAALIRTASNAWTLVPFSGGVGNADFSNAATGTYSDSGINYKYLTFTASGTLTVTKAGFADLLVVAGGGGGGAFGSLGGAGGGGGCVRWGMFSLAATTYTVTIGGGGAAQTDGSDSSIGTVLLSGGGQRGLVVNSRWNGTGGGGSSGAYNGNDPNQVHSGGGQGGNLYGSSSQSGITFSITGSAVEYGSARTDTLGGTANTGQGGGWRNVAGGSGVVVVRVRV